MKLKRLTGIGSDRLILVFAGWGMDPDVFGHLHHSSYDIAVVWDYRDFGVDWTELDRYKEICVIAWSMGVYAASMSCHGIERRVTLRVAVNGTPSPVDDSLGIPTAVYEATAATLDERRLRKFMRRMCGDAATFDRFMQHAPHRPVDELVDELHAIWPASILSNPQVRGWDRAFIGRDDAIFPAANQQRAWQSQGVPITVLERPHYIDLQAIIDHVVIDKTLAAGRFGSRRGSYDRNARIQQSIVDKLCTMIEKQRIDEYLGVSGHAVLEIGCGTGMLTRCLLQWVKPEALHLWDIADDAYVVAGAHHCQCDAELAMHRTLPQRFDAIVSASTVQWFNSPRRFMAECARVLRPGGWLILSAFGRGNMEEITQVTGRSLPLLPAERWPAMLSDELELIEFGTYTAELIFDSAVDVFRHLKLTGVNALGHMSAGELRQAINSYPMRLDGCYYLTYKPFILIARKRR